MTSSPAPSSSKNGVSPESYDPYDGDYYGRYVPPSSGGYTPYTPNYRRFLNDADDTD